MLQDGTEVKCFVAQSMDQVVGVALLRREEVCAVMTFKVTDIRLQTNTAFSLLTLGCVFLRRKMFPGALILGFTVLQFQLFSAPLMLRLKDPNGVENSLLHVGT